MLVEADISHATYDRSVGRYWMVHECRLRVARTDGVPKVGVRCRGLGRCCLNLSLNVPEGCVTNPSGMSLSFLILPGAKFIMSASLSIPNIASNANSTCMVASMAYQYGLPVWYPKGSMKKD